MQIAIEYASATTKVQNKDADNLSEVTKKESKKSYSIPASRSMSTVARRLRVCIQTVINTVLAAAKNPFFSFNCQSIYVSRSNFRNTL